MATPWSKTHRSGNHTFRKFRDGGHRWPDLESQIFEAGHSHKCLTYVHCIAPTPSGRAPSAAAEAAHRRPRRTAGQAGAAPDAGVQGNRRAPPRDPHRRGGNSCLSNNILKWKVEVIYRDVFPDDHS